MRRKNIEMLLSAAIALGVAGTASAATEHGKISKIDPAAKTFSLDEGSTTRAFSLGTGGKVMNGSKAITLKDLRVGEYVKVEYAPTGGKLVASRVDVTHKGAARPVKKSY